MEKLLSFDELTILASKLSSFLKADDVVAFIGDLGTGKTTFVQQIAKDLGIKSNLKSPTFNYVLEYLEGRLPLYHFDVYRLSDPSEVYEVGYEDYLHNGGVVLIEWADIIEEELPKEYIEIKLFHNDEKSRKISLQFIGNEAREKEMLDYVSFSN